MMDINNIPYLRNLTPKSKIAVLSGAGVSQESGISTFRDNGGLWDEYDVMEVATPQAWAKNRELVLEFYNMRRRQLSQVSPNAAHYALAELESKFEVNVITQNIDNLHERAGSTSVLHLHGELDKARSEIDPDIIYDLNGRDIVAGDTCELGSQLRPHVVWFGEAVPMMDQAIDIVVNSDLLLVVGTSLSVYPAAGLAEMTRPGTGVVLIDPGSLNLSYLSEVVHIREKATVGLKKLVLKMLEE